MCHLWWHGHITRFPRNRSYLVACFGSEGGLFRPVPVFARERTGNPERSGNLRRQGMSNSKRNTRVIPARCRVSSKGKPLNANAFGHCGSTYQIKNASIRRALVVRSQLRLSDLRFEVLDFGLGFWKDFASLG